jgi:hypothetical protein
VRRRSTCFLLSDTWPFGFNSRRRQILRIERTGGRGTASMPPWHSWVTGDKWPVQVGSNVIWIYPTCKESRNPGYQNPFILSLWEVWSFRVWNQKSSKEWYATLFLILLLSRYFGFFVQRMTTEPSRSLCSISYGNSSDSYGSRQRDWNIMNSLAFFLWGNPKSSKIAQYQWENRKENGAPIS